MEASNMIKKILFMTLLCLVSVRSLCASKGSLDLTVFAEGQLVPHQEIAVSSIGKKTTDNQGQLILPLDKGIYSLSIDYLGSQGQTDFQIGEDLTTVVTINVAPKLAPRFSVENPTQKDTQKPSVPTSSQDMVSFKGKLLSLSKQEPIQSAQVFIKGQALTARSDKDGEFQLNMLPGIFTILVIHPKYSSLKIDQFEIPKSGRTEIFTMAPAGVKLADYVVTAPHISGSLASLMDERRETTELVDVLGAEQMSKSGDSDAASAIKRVTGLTVSNGKYPFIRGMGGRYVTTQLNGFHLPSPNPSKRVVPLDMFPTGLLEGISVVKSAASNRNGEFGGGHILLRTKSVPDEPFFTIALSSSMSASRQDALSYQGGSTDWLGIDDGTRELPAKLKKMAKSNTELRAYTQYNTSGLTPQEFEEIGESFPNIYNVDQVEQPINKGISFAGGGAWRLSQNWQLGLTASGIYGDEWDTEKQFKADYPGGLLDKYFDITQTERLVKMGASAGASLNYGKDHSLNSFSSILRRTTDETWASEGAAKDWDGPVQQYLLKWQERQMLINQLWGAHKFSILSDLALDWRLGSAHADLYQPDTREYRYEKRGEQYQFATNLGSNSRYYSELEDTNDELGLDLSLPILWGEDVNMKLKSGFMHIFKTRRGKTRRFGFKLAGSMEDEILSQPLEAVLTPANISARNGFVLSEITQNSDTYRGEQTINGAYLQWDTDLFETYSLSLGLRQENSDQMMKTYALFEPDAAPVLAELNTSYLLPSFNSSVKIGSQSQVRLSLSKSLARPDFRELSPASYIDDEAGDSIKGNPELLTTEILALDLRYEWYGNANESFSLAGFVKELENPIEISIVPGTFQKEFGMAKTSQILGLELEWHQNLSRISGVLKDFKTGGNLSYMRSTVELLEEQIDAGIQTNAERPLQGQAPYVINIYLFYDNLRSKSQIGLLYNQMGKRISGIGTLGASDAYLLPVPQLDLVFSQKFYEKYKVGLKGKNLLKSAALEEKDGLEINRKERPLEYSMSLSASF